MMGKATIFDNIREWIGGIAFSVYLWSVRMTQEQFWSEQEEQALREIRQAHEPPPMRYWQHDETGRVCATVLQPSERWYEIEKGFYDSIVGAMQNREVI